MSPKLLGASDDPFRHFLLSGFYAPAFADVLNNWLAHEATWKRSVHDVYGVRFKNEPMPDHITQGMLTSSALGRVRELAEEHFQTRFRPYVSLGAHKLVEGQEIGIHADSIDGKESHRILVQMSKGWQDTYGGNLIFFGSDDPNDVRKVFRHAFNTAIGFRLQDGAYHAVTRVTCDQRYSIVYGFFAADRDFDDASNVPRTFATT